MEGNEKARGCDEQEKERVRQSQTRRSFNYGRAGTEKTGQGRSMLPSSPPKAQLAHDLPRGRQLQAANIF